MHKDIYLAPQKPSPKLLLFQNFIGFAWKIELWEKFYETPIVADELDSDARIVYYNFEEENYCSAETDGPKCQVDTEANPNQVFRPGFPSMNEEGQQLIGLEEEGFVFTPSMVPSMANFTDPSAVGQIHATTTPWSAIACPNPTANQAYFNQKGSHIQI